VLEVRLVRALRFDRFGDPSVLQVVNVPDPLVPDGWAVVRVHAASINPSDVKNVQGAMEGTVLPRTPGRDFAGVVEQGPPGWLGAEVFGTGGDLGFTVDGSHAELLALPATALARKPARLNMAEAASVGVTAVIAWLGLIEYAQLQAHESVAVIGASGGVGTMVAQIARWRGASRIIGVDRQPPVAGSLAERSMDRFVPSNEGFAAPVREALGGVGADVVFDTVGGITFQGALACLAHRGRLVEISSTGQRRVEFDLRDFYHNESRLIGADSRKLDASACAQRLQAMLPLFENGALAAPPIGGELPLSEAARGYADVAKGAHGRIVLAPQRQ
jgi:NADPH2:quinone reductase